MNKIINSVTNEIYKSIRKNKIFVLVLSCLLVCIAGNAFWSRSKSARNDSPTVSHKNMVTIESGSFLMGSNTGYIDEKPVHEVSLSSFKIDRYEVTYREYKEFLKDNPDWRKGNVNLELADLNYLKDWDDLTYPTGKGDYPVAYVSWHAARAYAQWAGKTLPTEAQWEYASRGGSTNMDYPWGNAFKPHLVQWKDSLVSGPVNIGQYTINGFGLNDVIGNVAEWTADGFESYQGKNEIDPSPSINRHRKVVRGGSWKNRREELRISARRAVRPNACLPDVGIRGVSN